MRQWSSIAAVGVVWLLLLVLGRHQIGNTLLGGPAQTLEARCGWVTVLETKHLGTADRIYRDWFCPWVCRASG
jgi:hypothetical protein